MTTVPKLLASLRDEAVALAEAELPSPAELRAVVGALIRRLEHIATTEGAHLLDELPATPATSTMPLQPSAPQPPAPVAVTPVPVVADAKDEELAQLRAQLAAETPVEVDPRDAEIAALKQQLADEKPPA